MNRSMPYDKRAVRSALSTRFCLVAFLMLSGWLGLPAAAEAEASSPFAALSDGDTLQIRLQEAVLMALEHNPTVTIQRLAPNIASTFASEQRAAFDPTISVSGSQSQTKAQRRLDDPSTSSEVTDDRSSLDLEVSTFLPTGTTISADVAMDGSVSNLYTDQYSGRMGVTITQALLQGFGVGANLAHLRKARMDIEISKAELKGVAERLVADVERAYWELYLAAEEIHIQRRSLELAQRQLAESLERVAVGRLPELELAAVRAEVAVRQGASLMLRAGMSKHDCASSSS